MESLCWGCLIPGESGFGVSQLGGYPNWQQLPEYPACPECGNLMLHYAQVYCSEVTWCGGGTFYCFFCDDCRISAVHYQCD